MTCTQRLSPTLFTAFGSPESSGIPRLVHIVFTLKVIRHRTATWSMFSSIVSIMNYSWLCSLHRTVCTLILFLWWFYWTLTPSCITWSYSANWPLGYAIVTFGCTHYSFILSRWATFASNVKATLNNKEEHVAFLLPCLYFQSPILMHCILIPSWMRNRKSLATTYLDAGVIPCANSTYDLWPSNMWSLTRR